MVLRLTPAELRKVKDRLKGCTRALEEVINPKPRKYRNEPTEVDGARFDSKREAKRWKELRLMLKAKQIQGLARQVEFRLPGNIRYIADFVYHVPLGVVIPEYGRQPLMQAVIEDAKGVRTKDYKLKKKLMASIGYKITEV